MLRLRATHWHWNEDGSITKKESWLGKLIRKMYRYTQSRGMPYAGKAILADESREVWDRPTLPGMAFHCVRVFFAQMFKGQRTSKSNGTGEAKS